MKYKKNIQVIICINAGSTSLKISIFSDSNQEETCFKGSPEVLIGKLEDFFRKLDTSIDVVLHRIAHAGEVSEGCQQLTEKFIRQIESWSAVAPLHNPLALSCIYEVQQLNAGVKQYAICDSGLYKNLPDISKILPLPQNLSLKWPIRKYGFHGLAHRDQFEKLKMRGDFDKIITLHLGGGSSATAWKNGCVIDTTMSFSPLDGIPMGTRSGSLDPGLIMHLLKNENYTIDELYQVLTKESGLKALSSTSGDMSELVASNSKNSRFAIDYYCRAIQKQIGSFCAILGGVDVLSFSGGIGENQPSIRMKIIEGLEHLGFKLNTQLNEESVGTHTNIMHANSISEIWITPVNEAAEMKRQFLNR